jgi:hypothetical protein
MLIASLRFIALFIYLCVCLSGNSWAQGVLRAEKRAFLPPETTGIPSDFAPNGLVYKGFTYYPSITLKQIYTDNVYAEPNDGQDDFLTKVTPSIKILKQYGGLQLATRADVTVERYKRFDGENTEDHNLVFSGTYTANSRWSMPFSFNYNSTSVRRGEPLSQSATAEPLGIVSRGASLGLTRRFNRLILNLTGRYDEAFYDDGKTLITGAPVIYRDNDRQIYSGRLGLRYDLALGAGGRAEHILFANLDIKDSRYKRRDYVNGGFSGVYRDSVELGGFIGLETSYEDRLFANIGIGYFKNDYDDPSLIALDDIDFGAEIEYALTPKWRLGAEIDREITQDNDIVQGEVETRYAFTSSYEVYSRLYLDGGIEYTERKYGQDQQTDKETTYKAGMLYLLNQNWRLGFDAAVASFDSSRANQSFDRNIYSLSIIGKM